MLYEVAYPMLYVCAKSRQISARACARMRLAPEEMRTVSYKPETCYRVLCWQIRKLDIELMMRVAPGYAARVAVKRFETTKRDPRAPISLPHQERFTTQQRTYRQGTVRMLCYGPENGPKILALHGWNGKAAMLHRMNLALAEAGFRVFAPDLPGHGASDGKRYSFHELGRAMREVFADQGEFAAIIGHSGGGLIAAIALAQGFPTKFYIPIGAPSSLYNLLRSYVGVSQMPEKTLDYITRYYDRRYRVSVETLGSRALSNLDIRTLVVHDRADWMVGVDNAYEWANAARESELMITDRLTHLSIVNAPTVHERILSFIKGTPVNA